jgi:putrescine transport system ATP-binding protein
MSAATAQHLRIEGVVKRYGQTLAVDGVSLDIGRNEIFALLGPSGCGKSTLMRMIAGMEVPSEGRIVLDGQSLVDVPAHQRPTNMMFQSYALFPHMTVQSNVGFGLRQMRPKMAEAAIRERVAEMLDMVQLSHLAQRKPHELSGGQQQRVALARSLARHPKLLLLDEPLSALDKKIRGRTQLELVSLIRRADVTCIMVTHDQEEAMTMADRIGLMSPHGTLQQVGKPHEVYERPNSRYSAEFVGETNLFEGRMQAGRLHCEGISQALALPPGVNLSAGSTAWLSLRPEHVQLVHEAPVGHPDETAAGEIADVAYLGDRSIVHVKLLAGHQTVRASVPRNGSRGSLDRGTPVWLTWRCTDGVVLTQ